MIRKVLMKTVALTTAVPVAVVMPAITAYADTAVVIDDGEVHDISGDIDVTDMDAIVVVNGSTVNVDGNIIAEGRTDEGTPDDVPAYGAYVVEGELNVTGNVEAPGVAVFGDDSKNENETNVIVRGDVISNGINEDIYSGAVVACGENTYVLVGGDAISYGKDSVAVDNAAVDVYGNVMNFSDYPDGEALHVENEAVVKVWGDVVNLEGIGIVAHEEEPWVFVEGDVLAKDTGIIAEDDARVMVDGSVLSLDAEAIILADNAGVKVEGDVIGGTKGVDVYLSDEEKFAGVEVWKDISSNGYCIFINGSKDNYSSIDEILARLPEIYTHGFVTKEGNDVIGVSEELGDYAATIKDQMERSINYIVNTSGKVTLVDNEIGTMKRYDVLTVSVPEEYEIEVGSTCSVIKCSDGTYLVTLNDIKGCVDITAIKKAISEATGASEDDIVFGVPGDGNYGAPAGAIVVSNSTASGAGLPAAEGGKTVSKVLSLDTKSISGAQFKKAIVDSIKSTPSGSALRLETSGLGTFDRAMLEALAANSTIDMEVLFTFAGQKLRVNIPAGFNVLTLLDSNGYCGFLRLASILGAEVVK